MPIIAVLPTQEITDDLLTQIDELRKELMRTLPDLNQRVDALEEAVYLRGVSDDPK